MSGNNDKVVLGIHSTVNPGTEGSVSQLIDGHAWISVTRDGKTEVYGLWPDDHPKVKDNGDKTDIRRGMEAGQTATANRYYELTPEQATRLESRLRDNVTWGYGNTCASWASDTVYRVTGERVQGAELLGLTDTPRQLIDSIRKLERQRDTTPAQPLQAGEIPSSSSLFGALHGDAHANPERQLYAQSGIAVREAGLDDPEGNITGNLAWLARQNGMRIDQVVVGTTGNLFVLEKGGHPVTDRRAWMPLDEAQQSAHGAVAALEAAAQAQVMTQSEQDRIQTQVASRHITA